MTQHPSPSTVISGSPEAKPGTQGPQAQYTTTPWVPDRTPRVGNDGTKALSEILEKIPDPEIPALSIVDLGIVRDMSAERVLITPTYTGCPATRFIEQSLRRALDEHGFAHVRIETTLSPPWSTDWISEEGRDKLRAYGIAPPPRGAANSSLHNETHAQCPRFGSMNTEEISRFGSTPCKALWRCRACAEPFDRFKCH